MKLSIFTFLLLSVFMFSSCDKGKFFKDKDGKEFDKENLEEKDECFEFVYPITYLMPDGYAISGADEKSLWTDIKEWYDDNSNVEEKPVLQYPVDVSFKDGTTATVNNEEEWEVTKEDCD